jgi:hypothetical protein
MRVRTVELLPSLFNWAASTLVHVLVEEVLQNFVNYPHAESMPILPAAQATPRTVIISIRLCIFVPDFLAPPFLAERRSPEAILQLIVPVLGHQDLLLEWTPLVDWLKASDVYGNTTYAIPDTALLAVDNTLMDHRMMLHRSDLPGCWAPPPPTQAIATGIDVFIAEELGAMRRAQDQAVADKKKTPQKQWGVEQVS